MSSHSKKSKTSDLANLQEIKLSILEQKLYELQSIHYPTIKQCENSPYPSIATIYTDGLLNYEISLLKQQEETL